MATPSHFTGRWSFDLLVIRLAHPLIGRILIIMPVLPVLVLASSRRLALLPLLLLLLLRKHIPLMSVDSGGIGRPVAQPRLSDGAERRPVR
jgi:hypothetical protein